tara:strand:- start:27 stop:377 length:351 start_codon:yes stop_codon:yes gene_type:complete
LADTFLLKPVDLTTTDATTIYTCPTTDDSTVPPTDSTVAIIKSILVSEDSNNADTITVTVTRSTAVFSVFKDKAVGAKGTVELLTNPLILNEGDIVKATAGTANRLHVLLSVMEIT